MTKSTITNVSISRGALMHGNIAIAWHADGCRFHIWANPRTLQHGNVVYKNPMTARPREPGYFPTRHLDATSKPQAKAIDHAMTIVREQRLIEAWHQERRADETTKANAYAAAAREEAARRAAPALLAALKAVLACPQAAPWLTRLPTDDGSASVWEAAHAAVRMAEGK